MSTEIAHAYISVSPNMQGFFSDLSRSLGSQSTTNTVSSAINSAVRGVNYSAIGDSASSQFSVSFSDRLKSGLSVATVAAGNILADGFTKIASTIGGGLARGISAADTFRNYGLVLESLGYSADQAQSVIGVLNERLLGLPTSGSDMIKQIQVLTATLGDLDRATSVGLAFNDMLLAAGASYEDTANAQSMFNKMLATGEYTTMRWQSVVSSMPGQMKMLSEHLLGVGASAWDLRDALNDGTVSTDDFLNAMVELDTTGVEGFNNFEKQARAATGGIGTALTNFQTRVGNGWKAIINEIGVEKISATIDSVSTGIRKALENLAKPIGEFSRFVGFDTWADKVTAAFEKFNGAVNFAISGGLKNAIAEFARSIPGFDSFAKAIDRIREVVSQFGDAFRRGMEPAVEGLDTLVGYIKRLGGGAFSHIAKIFDEIGKAVLGVTPTMNSAAPVLEAFSEAVNKVAEFLKASFGDVITILSSAKLAFRDFMGEKWDSSPLTALTDKLKELGDVVSSKVQTLATNLSDIASAIKEFLDSIGASEKINAFLAPLQDLANIGFGDATNVLSSLKDAFNEVANSAHPLFTAFELVKNAVADVVSSVTSTLINISKIGSYSFDKLLRDIDGAVNQLRYKINLVKSFLKIENIGNVGTGTLAIVAGFESIGAAVSVMIGHFAKLGATEAPIGKLGQTVLAIAPPIQGAFSTVSKYVDNFVAKILSAWGLMNKGIIGFSGAGVIMQSIQQGGIFAKLGTEILRAASTLESAWLTVGSKITAGIGKIQPTIAAKFSSVFGEGALAGVTSGFGKISARIAPLLAPVTTAFSGVSTKIKAAFAGLSKMPFLEPLMQKLPTLGLAFGGASSGALGFVSKLLKIVNPVQMVISSFITMIATNEEFRNKVGAVVSSIGSNLLPIFQKLGEILLNVGQAVLPPVMNAFDKLTPIFAEVGLFVLQIVDAILPLISILLDQLSPVLTVIADAIGNLIDAVMPIVETVLTAIISGLQTLLPIVTTVLEFIITIIGTVINVVGSVIAVVVNVVSAVISAVQPVAEFVAGIIQVVIAAIGTVIEVVIGIVTTIAGVVGNIISTVSGFIASVVGFLAGLVNTITSGAQSLMSGIIDTVTNIFNNVTSTVSNMVTTVLDHVGSIPGEIMGFFSNAGNFLVNAGADIINGLISGIQSALGGLWDTVSSIGGTIIELKGPPEYDKVMLVENGHLIMQGLVRGINEGRPMLEKELQSISDSIFVAATDKQLDLNYATDLENRDWKGPMSVKFEINNPVIRETADVDKIMFDIESKLSRISEAALY